MAKLYKRPNFFCEEELVGELRSYRWDCGSLAAPRAYMVSFVVPKTFMALLSAETNSIILFVSGRISTLFFLTHFSSTELCLQQYLVTHVVMQVHYHYLFIFTFRLIIGVG